MLKNVEMEKLDVTPEMAKDWLLNNDYEFQRKLKGSFPKHYADEHAKGHFKKYTIIEFAHISDRMLLMDGQHRLTAIVKSGKTMPLYVQHRYYTDLASIAEDYARTDVGKKRVWSDIVNALHSAMGIEDRLVLTNSDLNILKSTFFLIYRGFMEDGVGTDFVTLYKKTLEWQPYAKLYFDVIGNSTQDRVCLALRRRHMVAAAICTIRFSDHYLPEDKSAIDFWKQVLRDDGIGMFDPRKKLNRLLYESIIKAGKKEENRKSNQRKVKYTAKELLLFTTRAWEAYCNDEELRILRLPKQSTITIKHTPFNGEMTISQYKKCFENGDWGIGWPST